LESQLGVVRSKPISEALLPSTALKRSSHRFVVSGLYRDAAHAETGTHFLNDVVYDVGAADRGLIGDAYRLSTQVVEGVVVDLRPSDSWPSSVSVALALWVIC
jgi:hypothetical protein